jgi:hypothetical protein
MPLNMLSASRHWKTQLQAIKNNLSRNKNAIEVKRPAKKVTQFHFGGFV